MSCGTTHLKARPYRQAHDHDAAGPAMHKGRWASQAEVPCQGLSVHRAARSWNLVASQRGCHKAIPSLTARRSSCAMPLSQTHVQQVAECHFSTNANRPFLVLNEGVPQKPLWVHISHQAAQVWSKKSTPT